MGQRLYLTEDRERVVVEGDPEARFLLTGEADDLPEGYDAPKGWKGPDKTKGDGTVVDVDPAEGGAPLPKARTEPADKRRTAAAKDK